MIQTDGRRFVKQPGERYDVVIVDVPEPSTFQLNRFYTLEFMAEAARRMQPGGVLCFPLGSYDDYVGPEQAKVLAAAYRTLREVFARVLLIPGQRIFFLASDGDLTTAVAPRIAGRGIPTRLVDRDYLKVMLAPTGWPTCGGPPSGRRRSIAISIRSFIITTCYTGLRSSRSVLGCWKGACC